MEGHQKAVKTMVTDGTKIWSGSDDHSIRVWDLRNRTCINILLGHERPLSSLLLKLPRLGSFPFPFPFPFLDHSIFSLTPLSSSLLSFNLYSSVRSEDQSTNGEQ